MGKQLMSEGMTVSAARNYEQVRASRSLLLVCLVVLTFAGWKAIMVFDSEGIPTDEQKELKPHLAVIYSNLVR